MFRNLEAFNIKNNSVILQILFSPLVLFQLLFEATFMILIATNMTFEIKFPEYKMILCFIQKFEM